MENIRIEDFQDYFWSSKLVPPHRQIWGEIVTYLVKILKLCQTGGIEEKPASPVNSHFLPADQPLSLRSSSPDQESKNVGSKSEQSREDARPHCFDESKKVLDKIDQKN